MKIPNLTQIKFLDLAAMHAMTALLEALSSDANAGARMALKLQGEANGISVSEQLARLAYEQAESLLKMRPKQEESEEMDQLEKLHMDVKLLREQLKADRELHAQQLAACDVAALADTPFTHYNAKLPTDSPYWSPAYESVMRRTDECIRLRLEVERLNGMLNSKPQQEKPHEH